MRSSLSVVVCCAVALPWLGACPGETPCQTDSDCGDGKICVNQVCVVTGPPAVDASSLVDAWVDARVLDAGEAPDSARPDTSAPDQARPDTQVVVDAGLWPDTAVALDTATPVDTGAATDVTSAPDRAMVQDGAVATDAVGHDADCTPACGTRVCGDDGCGGSCGPCAAPTPACQNGACVACAVDADCSSGKCEKYTGTCLVRSCIYDEHCTVAYYNHCSSDYACVSGHDCVDELAYIPYPWDDTMTVVLTGDTSDADSNYSPTGSCGNAEGPEDIYELGLPRQVRRVTLTLQPLPSASSWDSVLYVAANVCSSTNLGCEDALTSAQPEVLVLSEPASSTVTVVVDGYEWDDDGAYRLTVTIDECDGDGDCTSAERCLSPAASNSRCIRE